MSQRDPGEKSPPDSKKMRASPEDNSNPQPNIDSDPMINYETSQPCDQPDLTSENTVKWEEGGPCENRESLFRKQMLCL